MIKNQLYQLITKNKKTNSLWGQEFLRDILIPDLLGDNTDSILYWAGKRMVQKCSPQNQKDLILFFQRTGLGTLALQKRGLREAVWQLSGPLVSQRIQYNQRCDFMLEAGFLAKYTERQKKVTAEATVKMPKNKNQKNTILICVHTDPRDQIGN